MWKTDQHKPFKKKDVIMYYLYTEQVMLGSMAGILILLGQAIEGINNENETERHTLYRHQ